MKTSLQRAVLAKRVPTEVHTTDVGLHREAGPVVDPEACRAAFTAMDHGTSDDWQRISRAFAPFSAALPGRVLDHLKMLGGDYGGFAVDRLQHSLQTATRASEAGRDEEYVVFSLLHDIGDTLGSYNHADIAAAILKPFLSEENHWIVENHGVFQGYYYFDYLGLDKNMRDKFEGHEHFAKTAEFCEKYDQNSFDLNYATMPLELFEPMVNRVLARPRRSIYTRD